MVVVRDEVNDARTPQVWIRNDNIGRELMHQDHTSELSCVPETELYGGHLTIRD